MNEKMIDLLKNEEFCVKFFDNLKNETALKTLLENEGISLSEKELQDLIALTEKQIAKADRDELTEDDLEDVAGGWVGWVIAGVASGIFFGYQVYKARKNLNQTVCR